MLRRHGLLTVPAGPSGTGWQRFERGSPNELWQMDCKGWIPVATGGEVQAKRYEPSGRRCRSACPKRDNGTTGRTW